MPVENLTGMPVAVQRVRRSLVQDLKRKGPQHPGRGCLEKFLERHRIRYTGGLNRELGEALREETGTNAVLFPTLELFDDAVPPKTALVATADIDPRERGHPVDGQHGVGRKRRPGISAPGPDQRSRRAVGKGKEAGDEVLARRTFPGNRRRTRKRSKRDSCRKVSMACLPRFRRARKRSPSPSCRSGTKAPGETPGKSWRCISSGNSPGTGNIRRGGTRRGAAGAPAVEDDHGGGAFPSTGGHPARRPRSGSRPHRHRDGIPGQHRRDRKAPRWSFPPGCST